MICTFGSKKIEKVPPDLFRNLKKINWEFFRARLAKHNNDINKAPKIPMNLKKIYLFLETPLS
jgi:hypothetical protein